ncbi:hypothetical protein HDU79_006052 [Rhizoclosmatium sp. JEL0117]|nr:hypothetical protein HDU79_006052 [Rhizoclosmatium sp. JEL0117]
MNLWNSAFGGDDGLLPQARNPLEPNPFAICATRNEDFVTAALSFKHFKYLNSVTTEEKLRAFALIMQGAEGSPSQGIQIRFYELAAQYKLAAWKEVSHVSKEDAQTQLIAYIAHLTEKYSHTKPQYPDPRRVDTHFHVIPDFYAKAVEENGGDPGGFPKVTPSWSLPEAFERMTSLGIAHGVMSVTAPGAAMFSGEDGRKMARKINEWQSQLVQENASKLSSFASLPNFFDVEGTIAEVEFALGELGAVGVVVFTSYHQGSETRYLGHPSFAPIWETINKYNAIVFTHPSHGPANMISKQLPLPIMDYPQETTRMAADLVTSGTTARFPNIKFILSHGGGTVPYLAQRIAGTGMIAELSTPLDYLQMMEEFSKFYYDVALSTSAAQLRALLQVADPERILYGSDLFYAPLFVSQSITDSLDEFMNSHGVLGASLLENINHRNAERLFGRSLI